MGFLNLRPAAIAALFGCALWACVGCTSSDEPGTERSTPATTSLPRTSSTFPASSASVSPTGPTVEGAYGCGPADGRTITITAHGLPDGPVFGEVVFADEVRNRSQPVYGPDLEAILMPNLPDEGYEPGAAQVRIVSDSEVVVSADVQPELPFCG